MALPVVPLLVFGAGAGTYAYVTSGKSETDKQSTFMQDVIVSLLAGYVIYRVARGLIT